MNGTAWPGLHASGLADVDQLAETRRPSAFFGALEDVNHKIADDQLIADALTAAVRVYECDVCGAVCEFTSVATIDDYAVLNRWLGHHNRCADFAAVEAAGLALVGTVRNLATPCAPSPAGPPAACAPGDSD